MGRSVDSAGKFRISESLVREFTYQLRLLLSQSYLVQEALQIMASVNTVQRMKQLILLLQKRLETGKSMTEALMNIQHIDRFYLSMIRAGEYSGNLSLQVMKLYEHLENRRIYKQKLNKASLYPTLVFSVTFMAVIAFLTFAVPMLVSFAKSLQVPLPSSTQRFIGILGWLSQHIFFILMSISIVFLLIFWFIRRNAYLVDYWKCAVPYFGKIFIEKELSLFCQQLSFLLSSHLLLPDCLSIASTSIHNRYLREQIEIGNTQLDYGKPISQSLQSIFKTQPFFLSALRTGEESNRLSENFAFLSTHYQQTLQQKQDRLLVLIEPVMLLTIGLFVLFIIIQFYLPIFQLLNQIDFSGSF